MVKVEGGQEAAQAMMISVTFGTLGREGGTEGEEGEGGNAGGNNSGQNQLKQSSLGAGRNLRCGLRHRPWHAADPAKPSAGVDPITARFALEPANCLGNLVPIDAPWCYCLLGYYRVARVVARDS